MSTTIDNRVVSLEFDNAQFEREARTTLNSLQKLDDSINYNGMQGNLQAIADRFSTLGIVGMTVTQNLTNTVLDGAKQILHGVNMVFDQIEQGGKRRAMNIEQAKFQLKGLGIAWDQIYDDINYAVEGTAYGLDAAATAAAQLSASGVALGDDMKAALRGISGVAAMTNRDFEEIAMVFTSAAGAGRVMGGEITRLSQKGINVAAELGKVLGKSEEEVRDLASKGEIDFMTFAKAMDSAFGEHAKDANSTFTGAMSNIKAALSKIGATFWTPVLTEMVEPLNRIREAINVVKDALIPLGAEGGRYFKVIQLIAKATSKLFVDTGEYLKQVDLIGITDGIFNAFDALLSILRPVGKAFQNVFPVKSVETVNELIKRFVEFTKTLELTKKQAGEVQSIFQGLFSIVSIFLKAIKSGIKTLVRIAAALSPIADGIIAIVVAIADAIHSFDQFVGEADIFGVVLDGIIKGAREAQTVFTSIFGKKMNIDAVGGIGNSLKVIAGRIRNVSVDAEALGNAIDRVGEKVGRVFNGIVQLASHIGSVIQEVFGAVFNALLKIDANEVIKFLLGGSLVALSQQLIAFFKTLETTVKQAKKASEAVKEFFGFTTLIDNMSRTFKELAFATREIGAAIKANINIQSLMSVAVSILILAAAMKVLASIDTDKLLPATAAITALFVNLFGSSGLFTIFVMRHGVFDIAKMLAAFVPLSISIYIIAKALQDIGSMNWNDITQGIIGMTAAFVALGAMAAALTKMNRVEYVSSRKGLFGIFRNEEITGTTASIMETAKALVVLAIALNLMVTAIKGLGELDVDELVKGLAGLYALMISVYVFCKKFNSTIEKSVAFKEAAKGLIALAASMYIFYLAAKGFASMSWEELGKGLGSLVAMIATLSIAISKMGQSQNSLIKLGTAFIMIAISMKLLVKTMQAFAGMSWEELGKSFVGMLAAIVPLTACIKILSTISKKDIASAKVGVNGILELSVALILVSVAFKNIAGLETTGVVNAFLALNLTLVVMTGVVALLGTFSGAEMRHAKTGVNAILELSVALILISVAFKNIAGLETTGVVNAFLALNLTLVVMTGVVALLGTFSGAEMRHAKTGVNAILELSVALLVASMAIAKLANVPVDQMLPAVVALGAMLLAMTAVVYVLSTMQGPTMANAILGAASVLVLSLALSKIAKALAVVAAIDFGKLGSAAIVLVGVMAAVVAGMIVVGNNALVCLAGIAVIMTAVYAMEGAIAITVLILGKLVAIIAQFMDTIDKLTTLNGEAITTNMTAIAKGFESFGDAICILAQHMVLASSARKTMKQIAEAIAILAPALDTITKLNALDITGTMSAIAYGLETFGESITTLGKHFILAKSARKTMIAIAEAISKLAPGIKTMSSIPSEVFESTMGTVASTFVQFGKAIESVPFWAPNNRAKAIGVLVDCIDKLAQSIPLLTDMPYVRFKMVMEGLADGFKGFGDALSNAPFWGADERGKAIDILVDDVKKLVEVFPSLQGLNAEEVKTNMETVGAAFSALGESLKSAPMFNADEKGEGIATLVDSITTLVDGVNKFNDINDALDDTVLTHIGDAFSELGNALWYAPLFGPKDRGEGIVALVNSLDTLTNGVKGFMDEFSGNTDELNKIMVAIGDAFSELGNALWYAPLFGSQSRSEGIAKLVDKVDDLATALHTFDEFDDMDRLTTIMTAIGDAFVSLGEALWVAPLFSPAKRADAIVSLLNSTNVLTDAVHKFDDISDMDRITTIMTAIGDAFVTLGAAISSTPFWNATGKAEALVSVVESVDVLVEALRKIMWVNDDTLTNAAAYIKDTLSMLGDSMDLFANHEYTTEQINDSVNGVNSIIEMLKNMAGSGDIVTAGESFNSAIESIATSNIQGIIDAFMGCDAKLQTAVGHLIDVIVKTVTSDKDRMTSQGNNIVTWIITGIRDKEEDVAKAGRLIVTWIKNAIIGEKLEVISKAKIMMSWIINTINDHQDELTTCGKDIVLWLNNGINDETSRATLNNSVTTMMNTVCTNIRDSYDDIYSAGSYLADGLANGISDNIQKVANAAAAMARAAKKAAMDELDEHSPSKDFYKIGDFADEGAANGISENTYKVTDAIKKTMQRVKDIAEDEGRLTVRPVLDLTDVKTGLRSIEDMFDAHQTIELAASIGTDTNNDGKIQASEGGVVNNITFNQTNNSPKALNRTEIYRQTRNQISQIKGVVRA